MLGRCGIPALILALGSACGGGGGGSAAGGTSSISGAWTRLTPSGTAPSPRWGHSAVFAPLLNGILIFGGCDVADGAVVNPSNDVWLLNLAVTPPAWVPVATGGTPPDPRHGHSAVLDAVNNRMLVVAGRRPLGNGAQTLYNDVWSLDLAVSPPTWTQVSPSGGPPAVRFGHCAALDEPNRRLLMFGGAANLGAPAYNDAWALDLAAATPAWAPVAVSGGPPSQRYLAASMFDAAAQTWMIVGGFTSGGLSSDVWTLTLGSVTSTWAQPPVAGASPSPRYGAYTVFDAVNDRMVLFGGATAPGGPTVNELWHLNRSGGLAWAQPAATSTPPSARYVAPAVLDAANRRMLLFGGTSAPFDPASALAELWELAL